MVFICYSHHNGKARDKFRTMFSPLRQYGYYMDFSDQEIEAGDLWKKVILAFLEKATVAVLLVTAEFFESKFIREVELPYLLKKHREGNLTIIWVPVSPCLHEETPLSSLQAALPPGETIEEMPKGKRDAAWKKVCQKVKDALIAREKPAINAVLGGRKFSRKVQDLQVLSRPATRRTDVFIGADNSEDWYHQGAILPGKMKLTCYFGDEKTKPGTGFHIRAITTDEVIPDQHGKPTKPFPKSRTESARVHVIRT
jgi:hypothetical protein